MAPSVELYKTILKRDYERASELQLKVNKARMTLHIARSIRRRLGDS